MDGIVYLVRNFVNTEFENISSDVIIATKKSILDTLASIIAGTSALGCPEIANTAMDWGGKKESSIINYNAKVPAFLAALVNGTMARAVDLDDVFEPGEMHASASIIPTAFAVAQMKEGINGKEFLKAVTLGIDMICRMGRTNKVPPGISGMTATFQYAYFACAGVAGKILGLDEARMIHSMGLAYAQTSGNHQNLIEKTLAIRFCQGLAAQAGICSAVFASKGITAASEVLEGKFGYYPVYQRDGYSIKNLLEGLGKKFEVVNTTTKKYPCCMDTHAAIDAILDISKRENLQSEELEKIIVKVNQKTFNLVCFPMEKTRAPETIPEAQFSIPYTVATAFVKRKVFLDDFTEKEIKNPNVLKVASKTDCIVDAQLEKTDKGMLTPAIVEVITKKGTHFSQKVDDRLGNPNNPMSMEEIGDKFRACAKYARKTVPEERIEGVIRSVNKLERLNDVTEIIDLLDA